MVVIAGRPTHVVVRTEPGPMTNLHLGNVRGDLAALRAAAGPDVLGAGDADLRSGPRRASPAACTSAST